MEINLLLRLIIAHLLTDFVFQPKSWVTDRVQNQGKSKKLYLHVMVTAVVAYLFSGQYDNWVIPAVIFISHLIIDYVKSKVDNNNFNYFISDQIAHVLVIILLWLFIENKWKEIMPFIEPLLNSNRFWIVAAGYTFVSWPLGIIIGKTTQRWRDQISKEKERAAQSTGIPITQATEIDLVATAENIADTVVVPNSTTVPDTETTSSEEQELGLASAGKWIGICERILILTFVIMGQFTAIGFLMTAKSILRFSEKEANTQLKTEYVLVGTLVSFASSAMIGMLINLVLKTFPL